MQRIPQIMQTHTQEPPVLRKKQSNKTKKYCHRYPHVQRVIQNKCQICAKLWIIFLFGPPHSEPLAMLLV